MPRKTKKTPESAPAVDPVLADGTLVPPAAEESSAAPAPAPAEDAGNAEQTPAAEAQAPAAEEAPADEPRDAPPVDGDAETAAADMPAAQVEAAVSDLPTAPVPDDGVLEALAAGTHSGPHSVLGQHPVGGSGAVVVRALRPLARRVTAVLGSGARLELGHVGHGVWQGVSVAGFSDYRLEAAYDEDVVWTAEDPYRFLPSVGEIDLHLFGEGRHERLWEMLGSHHRALQGVDEQVWGTSFAVWAPHARAVRLIGDFNSWNGALHSMRRLDGVGVWELFVPGMDPYNPYKYEILTAAGAWIEKADPMARQAEQPPATASVVTESSYSWGDSGWMTARAALNPNEQPISVYEMHFGSWRQGLGYREAADQLIDHLHETGFTHVEFLPLAEHPFEPSWGYQVTGYYAATSRFGHPDDLKYLIDRLHQARIGVYIDWVPGHFVKDAFALAQFDGEPLYEHSDPRLGEHKDWGTLIFNYGDSQVRNFLVANALFWLEEFHVDGLRVDAVASMLYLDYSREAGEWLPNRYGGRENLEAISFLQETTATCYKLHPGVLMMAEESTSWGGVTHPTDQGGLGFGLKWNMGWMNDTLRYIANDPMWRSHHQNELTFSFLYSFSESFILPISHDEVVHGKGSLVGKMPGDPWQQLANVRAYLALQWAHPGKQLLFMGQEFGQRSEWSESRSLDWWILDQPAHRGLLSFVSQLNRVYTENPSFWQQDSSSAGFSWIDGSDAQNSVLSFLRWDRDGNPIAAIFNFSGAPVGDYRVGLPFAGTWDELLNSDAAEFGGSGVGNYGSVVAEAEPSHGQPASVLLTLPPLGALYLRPKSRR